jgi:hypothetical protein
MKHIFRQLLVMRLQIDVQFGSRARIILWIKFRQRKSRRNRPYGPWPLLQFRNHFFTQSVGLLGRVTSPSQLRYLHTGQHKHRINAHTDIHSLSEIRTHVSRVQLSEDSSCLRPRGRCDQRENRLILWWIVGKKLYLNVNNLRQSLSYWRIFKYFVEPEDLI